MMRLMVLFFFIQTSLSIAQSGLHRKAADDFLMQFNSNQFESIYQSFSPKMQQARSKSHYFQFLSRIKKDHGKCTLLELSNYQEKKGKYRGEYIGHFENGNLTVKITTDKDGKIIGLYILKNEIYL